MLLPWQVQEQAGVTAGGLMLPDSAKEKPISGTVVRVGPGKKDKEGKREQPKVSKYACCSAHSSASPASCPTLLRDMPAMLQVKENDRVLYFKWAGENMETPSGEQYVMVHEQDILCRQK